MKKTNYLKLFTVVACSSALLVSSCKKEPSGPYGQRSSVEDSQTLKEASNEIGDVTGEVLASPGVASVASLSSVMLNKSGNKQNLLQTEIWKRIYAVSRASKSVFSKKKFNKTSEDDSNEPKVGTVSFDFQAHAGTYTWDASTEEFDFSKGGNEIVYYFPTDSTNKYRNNGKFTVSAFREVQLQDSLWLPTEIMANLTVDGSEMARLSFTASYESSGLPRDLALFVFVKPFTLSVTLNNSGTTSRGAMALTKDGESDPLIAFGATVQFVDASKEEVKTISEGYVQVKGLKVAGDLNVAAIQANDTPEGFNSNSDVHVYYNGSDLGKIVRGEDDKAYVRFADGSEEPVSTYLDAMKGSDDSGNNTSTW